MWSLILKLLRYLFSKAALFLVLLALAVSLVLAYQGAQWVEGHYEERLAKAEEQAGALRREIEARQQDLIGERDGIVRKLQEKRREIQSKQAAISELDEKFQYAKALLTGGLAEYEREKDRLYKEKQAAEASSRAIREKLAAVTEVLQAEDPAAALLVQHEAEVDEARRALKDFETWRGELTLRLKQAVAVALWPVLIIFLSVVLGPLVWRTLLYYCWAPLAQRATPIQLEEAEAAAPLEWSGSAPSQSLSLEPHERVLLRSRFLQSSEEPLRAQTQWLWSWRYPLTSLAAHQFLLTRLSAEALEVGQSCSITVSDMEDAMREISWVKLEAGQSLCFRPSFLAGVLYDGGRAPQIRAQWRFFSLQAWMTLQFRYFILEGPCRVVFAAGRGLKAEKVDSQEGQGARGGRRVNQEMTVAFQPELRYGSRRAETAFAGYLTGRNALFDDYFTGRGSVAVQQILTDTDKKGRQQESFWQSLMSGLGKLIGL